MTQPENTNEPETQAHGRIISDEWAAGFFEGEGYITINTPGPWNVDAQSLIRIYSASKRYIACMAGSRMLPDAEARANANLIAAAPELLAYAECEEAKRLSLLPTTQGGTGNGQSYAEVFNKHGWNGRDVYSFLDNLRRTAIAKARGKA